MATIIVQAAPARTGVDLTAQAVACTGGGDKFLPTKNNELVAIINGDASPHTVSITQETTVDGVTPAAKQITVPAGHTVVFGPFPSNYVDSNGFVNFTYDAVTSLKIAVFQPA